MPLAALRRSRIRPRRARGFRGQPESLEGRTLLSAAPGRPDWAIGAEPGSLAEIQPWERVSAPSMADGGAMIAEIEDSPAGVAWVKGVVEPVSAELEPGFEHATPVPWSFLDHGPSWFVTSVRLDDYFHRSAPSRDLAADLALGVESMERAGPFPPERLQDAQLLSGQGPVVVRGTVTGDEGFDLFRMEPVAGQYRVQLRDLGENSDLVNALIVLDGRGERVGGWFLKAGMDAVTVELTCADPSVAEPLYLAVGGPAGLTSSVTVPDSYALVVQPLAAPVTVYRALAAGSGSVSSPSRPPTILAGTSAPASRAADLSRDTATTAPKSASGDASHLAAAQKSNVEVGSVAVAAPLQMVAPRGGVLTQGDPVLAVTGDAATAVDLVLSGAIEGLLLTRDEIPPDEGGDAPQGSEPIVEAVAGPAGLPLMAIARPILSVDHPPGEPVAADAPALLALAEAVARERARPAQQVETQLPTSREGPRRPLVRAGVGCMLTLAVCLMIPDISPLGPWLRRRRRAGLALKEPVAGSGWTP